ncbi:hypothetical protein ES707_17716 [subsurface metagenome]
MLLLIRYKNSGAPTTVVMIPTGISNVQMVREIRSATSMKDAPTDIDAGRR